MQNLQSQKEGPFQSRQHNEVVVPIRTKSQQKRFKEQTPDLKIRVFCINHLFADFSIREGKERERE